MPSRVTTRHGAYVHCRGFHSGLPWFSFWLRCLGEQLHREATENSGRTARRLVYGWLVPDEDSNTPAPDWNAVLASAIEDGLVPENADPVSLWPVLRNAAQEKDGDDKHLLEVLMQICSFYPRPEDWVVPYGPMLELREGRTATPSDLGDDTLAILVDVVATLPSPSLRARVYDVLALRASGRERVERLLQHLQSLSEVAIEANRWFGHDEAAFDRGLLVARRLGGATATSLTQLESKLVEAFSASTDAQLRLGISRLLAKHQLARESAITIASALEAAANDESSELQRALLEASADWFLYGGDAVSRHRRTLEVVLSLQAEAEQTSDRDGLSGKARSSHLYERALQVLRTIPRKIRDDLGIGPLTAEFARRIREGGAASLGSMHVFESDSINLSEIGSQARNAVRDLPPLDALAAFAGMIPLASVDAIKKQAEELLEEHPLQTLFTTVHYARDGRVVHRSSNEADPNQFGVDPVVWGQMIQTFDFRVTIVTQGLLAPAWRSIATDHLFALGDFYQIVRNSPIVPADRERLVARGLYLGYDGDFASAAQLLTPQLENMVRLHLANAGESTSTVDGDAIEQEVGLSALMARPAVEDIFGADLSFEIRALFCGPLGHNLRNEIAHGLVDDRFAGNPASLYAWWLILRMVFMTFWNSHHDTEAADAREPSSPDSGDLDSDAVIEERDPADESATSS